MKGLLSTRFTRDKNFFSETVYYLLRIIPVLSNAWPAKLSGETRAVAKAARGTTLYLFRSQGRNIIRPFRKEIDILVCKK